MKTYVIRREKAWEGPEQLQATAERSKRVAEQNFPDDISWIRSYVIAEPGGSLGTVCIYQASGIEAVREHAARVDMPADEILEVADTVVIRPDPQPLEAGAEAS
jgi:Nickel responsive protein SCO4226-like